MCLFVGVGILCHGRGAVEMCTAKKLLSDECVPLCWVWGDWACEVCLVEFKVPTEQETVCWRLARRVM